MKRLLLCVASLVCVPSAHLQAQGDRDPSRDCGIAPEAGTWMILATSYVGPEAPRLAQEMALEIRNRFKLPAYVLNRGALERQKQEADLKLVKEQYDALNKLRLENHEPEVPIPRRLMPKIQEQCAVLVGGYKDLDEANRALKEIKKLPPPSKEELCPILTQVSTDISEDGKHKVESACANPFVNAFVVRNPTVPREQKSEDKANDPFLKKLNAHESYSLLKCKKRYTLLVAVFKGMHTFQPTQSDNQGFFEKLWAGNNGELLDASGQNAHNLAGVLRSRDLGFEAYVLHMREGSAVTIGGFDREDDPQIKALEAALASRLKYNNKQVQFLPEPLVIRIPHP